MRKNLFLIAANAVLAAFFFYQEATAESHNAVEKKEIKTHVFASPQPTILDSDKI